MSYFTISREIPVFPTVWGNTLISRLFDNPAPSYYGQIFATTQISI